MRRDWKGTRPVSVVFRGKKQDVTGWRTVLAILADAVLEKGKTVPGAFLKREDNGHRTVAVRGVFVNVNLCNGDMVPRVRALSEILGESCVVTYTREGSPETYEVTFGPKSVVAPKVPEALEVDSALITPPELASLLRVDEAVVARLTQEKRIPRIVVAENIVRYEPDAVLSALRVEAGR